MLQIMSYMIIVALPQEDTTAYSMKCNISIEVNDLDAGMRLALKDDREKRCAPMCPFYLGLCSCLVILLLRTTA